MAAGPWRGPNIPINVENEATAKFGSIMADKGLVGPPPRQSDMKRPFNLAPAAQNMHTVNENIFMTGN